MTLIPDTKDTTPQTLQNENPAGNPAVNLNTLRWQNTAATRQRTEGELLKPTALTNWLSNKDSKATRRRCSAHGIQENALHQLIKCRGLSGWVTDRP